MNEVDSDPSTETQVQVVRLRRFGTEPLVASGGIDVWFGAVVQREDELNSLYATLSNDERERADLIRHPSAKAQMITGRARLRTLSAAYLNCLPEAVEFEVRPDGKPTFRESRAGVHFNLSHTHDLWAAVFAPCEVGIDLERLRPMLGAAALMKRYFHAVEAEQCLALPEPMQLEGFFRGWTLKEAVLKGIGCGIRGLERVVVDLDPRLPPRVLGDESSRCWRVACLKPTAEHVLSVAVNTDARLVTS